MKYFDLLVSRAAM